MTFAFEGCFNCAIESLEFGQGSNRASLEKSYPAKDAVRRKVLARASHNQS